ncbi:MAG: hypothetical protein ACYC9X_12040 [Dehalococcoidia bacterium]
MPWLTAKRRVGELLLEFQTLRHCGKYRPGEAQRQREIAAEVRACNQRGDLTWQRGLTYYRPMGLLAAHRRTKGR